MRSFCSSQSSLGFRLKQPSEPCDQVQAPASNATTSTHKDDLRLRPYQSRLELTSWPIEETLVRQPVRVLDDGKHQTGRRANTRHEPKRNEEADGHSLRRAGALLVLLLYPEEHPLGKKRDGILSSVINFFLPNLISASVFPTMIKSLR